MAEDVTLRLERLERQAAHQDRLVAELNEVVTTQWQQIEALERRVARLKETLETMDDRRDGPEPPPPHY